jgi:hypothetical protein
MKISFFQTYGDRLPLLKIREEDTLFQKFISNFDLNIISLHNVSDSIKSYVNSTPIVPNQIVWDSQGKTYGQSINFLVDFLLNNKVDRFFFYQDDTFSHEITESNLNDLVITGLIPIFDLINISYKLDYLKEHKLWNEPRNIIYHTPSFKVYDTTTFDFTKSGLWAFDDSCFICSQWKLTEIYDQSYFNHPTVWSAEHYLRSKFERINMLRPVTDIAFFINYNILGKNTHPQNIINLKKVLNLSKETENLLYTYLSR